MVRRNDNWGGVLSSAPIRTSSAGGEAERASRCFLSRLGLIGVEARPEPTLEASPSMSSEITLRLICRSTTLELSVTVSMMSARLPKLVPLVLLVLACDRCSGGAIGDGKCRLPQLEAALHRL